MGFQKWLLFIFLLEFMNPFLHFHGVSVFAQAQDQIQPPDVRSCSQELSSGFPGFNSQVYNINLYTCLSTISSNINDTGSYSLGEGANSVNVVAHCPADVQLEECRRCIVSASGNIIDFCHYSTRAFLWRGSCILRVSNPLYALPDEMDPPDGCNRASIVANAFYPVVDVLLTRLVDEAASGVQQMKVAAGSQQYNGLDSVYALVQCASDVPTDVCKTCLQSAKLNTESNCGKKAAPGGIYVARNCILRFEIFPFFNSTRLHELDNKHSVPSPSPGEEGDAHKEGSSIAPSPGAPSRAERKAGPKEFPVSPTPFSPPTGISTWKIVAMVVASSLVLLASVVGGIRLQLCENMVQPNGGGCRCGRIC